MPELLSYAEVQKLLDEVGPEHQKLLDDIVPAQITVSTIQRVLQMLLSERISIRDLASILEGIAEAVGQTQNVVQIAEHVRARLARQICSAHQEADGFLPLITLSPQWEQAFAESLAGERDEMQLNMAPSQLHEFINQVRQGFEEAAAPGSAPALLTSPGIRPDVRSVIERFRPQTFVMSQGEVHPQARLKTVGSI